MRAFKLTLAPAVAAGATALALIATPAAHARAYNKCVFHPRDPSSACVNHNWIRVCDGDVDGHRVRAWFVVDNGYPAEATGWAPRAGCHAQGDVYPFIIKYRVCVQKEGCSAWKRQ